MEEISKFIDNSLKDHYYNQVYKLNRFNSVLEKIFYVSFLLEDERLYNHTKYDINGIKYSKIRLRPQYKCGKYRIDFAIIKKNNKIAVELDGFSYHDRNKEQFNYERERGRYIVSKGFKLIRFTWDDITKNFHNSFYQVFGLFKAGEILNEYNS